MNYNYNYGYDASGTLGTAGAVLGILAIIMILFCLVVGILEIIGTWKILKKGGQPGWGSLIPIYGQYLLCKVAGVNPWWLLIVFVAGLVGAIPVIGSIVYAVVVIYFVILLNVSLARSFGKSDSFAVGLILLSPIFVLILGLKGEYQGPKPMKDIIFKNDEEQPNPAPSYNVSTDQNVANVPSNPQPTATKFCTNCGQPVNGDAKFCTSCGKEIV